MGLANFLLLSYSTQPLKCKKPASHFFMLKAPKTDKPAKVQGEWAVLIMAGNLLLVSNYAVAAVARLKQIVPPGARRFQRSVGLEFFASYGLTPAQGAWLTEAKLFNGSWQLLHDYRRPILEALTLEYAEVWTVEQGKAERQPARPPKLQPPLDPLRFGLAENVQTPLSWAKSYALYCHRHRTFEVTPCQDVGILQEATDIKTKDGHKASFLLRASRRTLLRARRKQTSYYLADGGDIIRLGRDAEGAQVAQTVIESQRLALVIRAATNLHPPSTEL